MPAIKSSNKSEIISMTFPLYLRHSQCAGVKEHLISRNYFGRSSSQSASVNRIIVWPAFWLASPFRPGPAQPRIQVLGVNPDVENSLNHFSDPGNLRHRRRAGIKSERSAQHGRGSESN